MVRIALRSDDIDLHWNGFVNEKFNDQFGSANLGQINECWHIMGDFGLKKMASQR